MTPAEQQLDDLLLSLCPLVGEGERYPDGVSYKRLPVTNEGGCHVIAFFDGNRGGKLILRWVEGHDQPVAEWLYREMP